MGRSASKASRVGAMKHNDLARPQFDPPDRLTSLGGQRPPMLPLSGRYYVEVAAAIPPYAIVLEPTGGGYRWPLSCAILPAVRCMKCDAKANPSCRQFIGFAPNRAVAWAVRKGAHANARGRSD